MNIQKKLSLSGCIFLTLLMSKSFAEEKATEKTYKVNTLKLITNVAKDMPDCLDYRVNQLVLKMKITPLGPVFYWTLNISHNDPSWLTMTHIELDGSPYTEFNLLFGKPYKEITQKTLTTAFHTGVKDITMGRERYKDWGNYQAVQSSEATIMGHPGTMILDMYNLGGLKAKGYYVGHGKNRHWHSCQTHGCLEEKNSEIGKGIRNSDIASQASVLDKRMFSAEYLKDFSQGRYSSNISKVFNYKQIHDVLAGMKNLDVFFKGFGTYLRAASASVGARIDYIYCGVNIAPFVPYYLSGIDALSWRGGYPVTDPEYSKIIMNPASKDTIGGKEIWGHIYPREGTVNINHTAKMAAVVAYRSNSVLSDEKHSGIRIYRTPPWVGKISAWSKTVPPVGRTTSGASKSSCHKKISNTGTTLHNNSTYAYTSWSRYRCDLAGGTTISRIPLKIQITPKVPE